MYNKFSATNIFNGTQFLGANKVLIAKKDGTIESIVDIEFAGDDVQKFEGFLCPGFINAHCHLELSFLKNAIPKHVGMVNFLLQVVKNRDAQLEFVEQCIVDAENEMIENGIVAVGDICNTNHTIKQKKKQNLYYHNFIEVAGFVDAIAQNRFDDGLKIYNEFETEFPNQNSIVPHAPYSVSKTLFGLINQFSSNKISSIHHQESQAENDFFRNKTGDFLKLYSTFNININSFNANYNSSTDYFLECNKPSQKNILVHNTLTTQKELLKIKNSFIQYFLCICVLSNEFINNNYPSVQEFMISNQKLVVGTDSLASNDCLNILKELQTIKAKNQNIPIEYLLQMATKNGAQALNINDTFGTFDPGKKPGLLLINDFFKTQKPIILK